MKRYPDNMEWPEYDMNPCSQHTLIIHRTLKERVEDLEEELTALHKTVSSLQGE
jgi:hypothetical protein